MLIKNTTDKGAPKPIGIGTFILMPGESEDIPDDVVYVDEFDKRGQKTGKKIILPSIVLMAGLNQLSYTETKKEAPVEEAPKEEVAEKPKRTRKKAE